MTTIRLPYNLLHLLLLFTLLPLSPAAFSRSFQAEGSDLLAGVGAEGIALGGAAVANTDDIYAIYWNPAGLAEMKSSQFSVSKQLNSTLSPVNFIGIGIVSEKLNFSDLKSTLSFALIPRLHATSTGHYLENDLESMFLRYAIPGLPGDFDGTLETKTRDYRLSWALTPRNNPKWSAALTLSRIECASTFCGVTANDPGNYTVASSSATSHTLHLGAKYYFNRALTFGLNIEDLNTKLKVHTSTTDNAGTRKETYTVSLPRDITAGMNWHVTQRLQLSMDYQNISGKYGDYTIDAQLIRGAINHNSGKMNYRGGLIVPLVISGDKVGDIKEKIPFPFIPTAGLGWSKLKINVDLALYPHTLMSHHTNSVYPAADLSITYKF